MNLQTDSIFRFGIILGVIQVTISLLSGCATTPQANHALPAGTNDVTAASEVRRKGGAQLWSARCTQCHYARDPGTFSQEQWEIIMMHMRVRANLTAYEHEAILEFFKPAN